MRPAMCRSSTVFPEPLPPMPTSVSPWNASNDRPWRTSRLSNRFQTSLTSAIVEVNDVWKRFDSLEVLQGLSFEAFQGETLVGMGGSGSGKTVLLRHIAGLIQPDQGQIKVFGQNIEALSEEELLPFRRRMGFVFQGAALFDSLTIHENVAYPLREHMRLSEDEIQGRVVEALARVGLREDVLPLLPSELSGGMRKRVGIARALMLEPEMMLYDEPTAGLDPTNAHLVSDLISEVQARVCDTSIVVTHDLELTRAVATRVAVLIDGRFAALGPRDAVLDSDEPAVHAFLTGDATSYRV